jgi:hypothetical protein
LKDEVVISQLWNGAKGEITYCPLANKICNALTQQAGAVMTASNALLDRFMHIVLARLHQDIDVSDFTSHRRYCSLSILTAGSYSSKCDGFANTPHVDRNDSLEKAIQNEAIILINELKRLYHNDAQVLKELKYLELLSRYPKGFCVPTTCGYTFVSTNESESVKSSSDFAMIGLGVSVQIVPGSYHYFMAPLFTHCTPVPVSMYKNDLISVFSESYNVVGWGASQSVKSNNYKKQSISKKRKKPS